MNLTIQIVWNYESSQFISYIDLYLLFDSFFIMKSDFLSLVLREVMQPNMLIGPQL